MNRIFTLLFVVIASFGFAQENLVPNPAFDVVTKKVKAAGQIGLAAPWKSPTLAPADLYIVKTKSTVVGIPNNIHGEEKAMEGSNYAGFMAYSYKNKKPRTYLQVKLTEKLVAGEEYLISINVSLADLSKYACSHLGVYVSKNEVSAKNSGTLLFDPQIISRKKTIYDQQFYWTSICEVYKAKGGEEYITIGNFTPDEKVNLIKVKRPRGFTKPQSYDAYYYIDNISVELAMGQESCECDCVEGMENAKTVKRDFTSDKKDQPNKPKIIDSGANASNTTKDKGFEATGMSIQFDSKSFSIVGGATSKLDKVVAFMKANSSAKIKLTGHIGVSERFVEKLDGRRVSSVYKYILSKGISKERVERGLAGSTEPVSVSDETKNRRVEIKVIK